MTITPVKDRDPAGAGEVCVYWNIPRKCWSITAVKGNDNRGLLLAYADELTLVGCRMVVQESRRQAIIKGDREVCAWVIGKLADDVVTSTPAAHRMNKSESSAAGLGACSCHLPAVRTTYTRQSMSEIRIHPRRISSAPPLLADLPGGGAELRS
jgi:hypothetical protein